MLIAIGFGALGGWVEKLTVGLLFDCLGLEAQMPKPNRG